VDIQTMMYIAFYAIMCVFSLCLGLELLMCNISSREDCDDFSWFIFVCFILIACFYGMNLVITLLEVFGI
jgi:hypothetical protein